MPRQIEVLGAAANFVPSGAKETMASQLVAAGVDQGSQPAPSADEPLPHDVAAVMEGEEPEPEPEPEPSSDPDESCAVIGTAPIPGGLVLGLALWFVRRRRARWGAYRARSSNSRGITIS